MEDQNYLDFKRYLSLQNNRVRANITEVSKESLGQSFMLHIDKKTPKAFIPMMPRSAAISEDNTVPRIIVANTLLGCILGYARFSKDFNYHEVIGYYINKLNFDYCVKPNNKLVYDAEDTNEHWLLGYNKQTLQYKPKTIGKLFSKQLIITKTNVAVLPKVEIEFYIELNESILFTEDYKLKIGYYKVNSDITLMNLDKDRLNHKDTNKFKITSISKSIYEEAKNISAVMLDNNSTSIPLYNKW